MRGLLGLPLVLLHLRHAASLAVIDEQQQPNFSILRSAYVDALFQRRSAFNTSCSETELHHKEGSYFVCSLLSRNKTTEEHTAGRVLRAVRNSYWSFFPRTFVVVYVLPDFNV